MGVVGVVNRAAGNGCWTARWARLPRFVAKGKKAVDGEQFDELIRRVSSTRLTRLGALRGLTGGLSAALGGAALAVQETAAKKKGKSHKKQSAKHKQKQKQASASECRTGGHPCEGGQACCQDLACVAGSGSGAATRCCLEGSVVCGSGSTAECCPPGASCVNEQCVCANNEEFCGFVCCPAGQTCDNPDTGTCSGGTPCGAEGQPCCDIVDCNGNLECIEGICQCGDAGEPCCDGTTCDSTGLICINDACTPCGGLGQPCCNGDCGAGLNCGANDICVACGTIGQPCCDTAPLCTQGSCHGQTCEAPPAPPSTCPTVPCPAGSVCNTESGICLVFGITCRTGETAEQCCLRAVRKGCKRKQSSSHARKNCTKKGKKRCNLLLHGVG
jgi:hypothetical protein